MRAKRSPNLMSLALFSALTILGAVAGARSDDKSQPPPPVDPGKAVRAFESSLGALPTKEDRIDATRKFFNGLKDSAAKIEAVGVFERWDEAAQTYFVRKKDGTQVRVPARGVRHGKVVPDRPAS